MGYMLLFFIVTNTAIAIATVFKKKIEETIFLSIFSYVLILFLTGSFFNSIIIGFYIIVFGNVALLIYNIFQIIKNRFSLKNQLFTVGFICFLLSYLLFIWICLNRKVIQWDELSNWAIIVKNMFNLENLAIGSESTSLMKSYLPGSSLFQFFCTKLSGKYDESFIYIGMNLMIISTIIPVLKCFNNKKNIYAYMLFPFIFCLPMIFYRDTYYSIYVDAVLTLTFSYSLYSYFLNYDEDNSKYKLINLSASLSMLVLLKDFGFALACGTFFIVLIDNIFIKKKGINVKEKTISFLGKIRNLWNNNKLLILAFIPVIIIKIIWSVLLKTNKIELTWNTSNIISTIINLFKGDLLAYQQETLRLYIKALFENNIVNLNISLSYIQCLGIDVILGIILINFSDVKHKKSIINMVALTSIGGIGFAFVMLITPFLSLFSEYEALRLASYERYICYYVLAILFLDIALLINNLYNDKKKLSTMVIVIAALFLLVFKLDNILCITFSAREYVYSSNENRSSFNSFNELTNKYVEDNETVFFVATNTVGYEYYVARYELTPKKLNQNTYDWSIGVPYYEGDIWTRELSSDSWKENLLNNYNYVYLYKVDEQFISIFGNLFYNENIESNQLYRVIKDSNENKILELLEK